MPQKERQRVFNGELKKTSGGLTAKDLVKNKRGKIVSKKKSQQAVGTENNLGSWLRGKEDKFSGKPRGFKEKKPDEKKVVKVAAAVKKKKPAAAVPKKKVEPASAGEVPNLANVSVGNILRSKRKRKVVNYKE